MIKHRIPERHIEGFMMPRATFLLVAEGLASYKFDKWAEELGTKVDEAMNKALNSDNRLSNKTRIKIFDNFIKEMESKKKVV